MTKPDHARMIARLPEATRAAVVDAVVNALRDVTAADEITVDYSPFRDGRDPLSLRARRLLGRAWPTAGTTDVLIVEPYYRATAERLAAVSLAHLIRVRVNGHVLAGPPVPGQLEERRLDPHAPAPADLMDSLTRDADEEAR